ncbi:hypothetical protein [Ectobacillus polymachus]|uniref:hypothetical protein n=1 Tax=Ectobacillus polymachus TaxID=1508806 RepID=UPI003A8A77B5
MNGISFSEWIVQDLEKQGYVGADLIGRQNEILFYFPESLQQLAEEARFNPSAKRPLLLYIQSLRDPEVQMKRDVLTRFLHEA